LWWGTRHWHKGDYIRDVFTVTPGDATTPPGVYSVHLGVYRGTATSRWDHVAVVSATGSTPNADGTQGADSAHRVILGRIELR